ncbi:MAG: glyoxalase [Pirellulaceae bacterium]|nr:glyoxalase [Pirellulaceae bacterium]
MHSTLRPFHLAFPVTNLEATQTFFEEKLGCTIGRMSDHWIDIDFFGHQVTAHLCQQECGETPTNTVDNHQVPVRHFGIILTWQDWHNLAEKLKTSGTTFLLEPYLRFEGQPGEQATFFLNDPSGNGLEFKAFRHDDQLFETSLEVS